jgi:four helix bundle protein
MTEKIRHFKDLLVWQKAHELALKIYKYSEKMPKTELFGITSQIRRASTSITANIAEGMGRNSYADRVRFYYNARGSIYEVESFLITIKDLGYLPEADYNVMIELLDYTRKILNNFIRSTEEMRWRHDEVRR